MSGWGARRPGPVADPAGTAVEVPLAGSVEELVGVLEAGEDREGPKRREAARVRPARLAHHQFVAAQARDAAAHDPPLHGVDRLEVGRAAPPRARAGRGAEPVRAADEPGRVRVAAARTARRPSTYSCRERVPRGTSARQMLRRRSCGTHPVTARPPLRTGRLPGAARSSISAPGRPLSRASRTSGARILWVPPATSTRAPSRGRTARMTSRARTSVRSGAARVPAARSSPRGDTQSSSGAAVAPGAAVRTTVATSAAESGRRGRMGGSPCSRLAFAGLEGQASPMTSSSHAATRATMAAAASSVSTTSRRRAPIGNGVISAASRAATCGPASEP